MSSTPSECPRCRGSLEPIWRGEHRDKFLQYMEKELHGKTGYKSWKEVWGNEDWKSLGAKVDAHFDKLLQDMGIVKVGIGGGK